MTLIRTAAKLLAVGTVLVAGNACSAEVDDTSLDETAGESSEEALRSSQSNTVSSATARSDSFIKTSTADSSRIASTEKCAIDKGEVLKLKGATIVGNHVRGLLMSAHGCGGKFGGGAVVFAFRDHYTWPAGLPSNPDEEDGEEPSSSGSGSNRAGPCAGTAFDRAVGCAIRKGARVLSYYRSPADQERVRRENGCTNRCTGMDGCVRPTAGCTSSPHTSCRAIDLINDGAPVSRAGLRACGLAKTSLPHANHYDFVN